MRTEVIKKIAIVLAAAAIIPVLLYYSQRRKINIRPVAFTDTNLVNRYSSEQRRDTVFRWTDRIIYKNQKPGVIYVQKTDTVFRSKLLNYDLPLRIEKNGNTFDVKAYNMRDSTLKEYVFGNVARDFTLTAKDGELTVKDKNFYIERPCMNLRTIYIPAEKRLHYEVYAETGFSFRERFFILAGCGYASNGKNIFLNAAIKIKGL